MSKYWKIALCVIAIFGIFCLLDYAHTWNQIREIERSWEDYRIKYLETQAKNMQKEFDLMETESSRLLQGLIRSYDVVDSIVTCNANMDTSLQKKEIENARSKIFQYLFQFSEQETTKDRGFAIYNFDKDCVAWHNCDPSVSRGLLEECCGGENGKKFSTISESKSFVRLCTFIPVRHPNIRNKFVGVVVCFLKLDSNYPLTTKYIQRHSLAQKMLQKYRLQNIQICYGNDLPSQKDDMMYFRLRNSNGDFLGQIGLGSFPKAIVIQDTLLQTTYRAKISFSLVCVFLTGILFFYIKKSVLSKTLRGCTWFVVLLLLRWIFWEIDFPGSILPESWTSSHTFFSPILGEYACDSLSNLLTTFFLCLCLIVTFWTYVPPIPIHKIRSGHGILVFAVILFAPTLCHFAFSWMNALVHEVINMSTIEVFRFNQLYPDSHAFGIYATFLLTGGIVLFLLVWYLQHILNFPNMKLYWLILVGNVLGGGLLCMSLWHTYPVSSFMLQYWISPIAILIAGYLWTLKLPKISQIRFIAVFFLLSIVLYLSMSHAYKQKIRTIVQDKADEFQSHSFSQRVVRPTLDFIEHRHSYVLNTLRGKNQREKDNIAFLLWINSPFSDSLESCCIAIFLEDITDSSKYTRVSHFTINMQDDFMDKVFLSPSIDSQQKIVPENDLYYSHFLPLTENNKIVGFVILAGEYPQIHKISPVPKIFTKKSPFPAFPLVIASFENNNMVYCNRLDLPKCLQLPRKFNMEHIFWYEQELEGRWYDCLFFKTFQHVGMIAYPLWSWPYDVYYYIQFLLFGLVFALLGIGVYSWHDSSRNWFCFEYKLVMVFTLIAGIPVFATGIANKHYSAKQIWSSNVHTITAFLQKTESYLKKEVSLPLFPGEKKTFLFAGNVEKILDDSFCWAWAEHNDTTSMLNFYYAYHPFDLKSQPTIAATNYRELFQTELLPECMSGEAFYHLILQKKSIYVTYESIGDYVFLVGYKGVQGESGDKASVGIISIPMIYQTLEGSIETTEIAMTMFNIYIAILLLVILCSLLVAHQISRPLAHLVAGIRRVSEDDLNFEIPAVSNDEFRRVIQAFNQMTKDLQISRQKLVIAEKDAAWREMSRQIAHEIKNPLTPMKLSAQHIQRAYQDQAKNFDKILEKGITTIISAIDNLARTASTFSEFAKFTKPNLGKFDMEPILLECIQLFSHTETITIENKISKVSNAIIDPHQIKRVIINLLTNAIQAIQKPPGKIIVWVIQPTSEIIRITVEDNGIGIPESAKQHLFEPNFSTKTYGSGLGLALCQRAVLQMAGKIYIESQENIGTKVIVELRAAN